MANEVKIIISAVDQTKSALGGITKGFVSFGKIAVGAVVGVGAALGGLAAAVVGPASDLAETANKIQVVFGDAAGAVNKFAEDAAGKLGQSTQAALDAAATFGVFGKSAGLSGGELGNFSTELAGLASDLASFYNTSPEEAIVALGAALRGESEPIRRYGVLLDDATLRQTALELGIVSTTKDALTPQQKVLAANAAIWKQTSDAQGDFARTSDGLANQQRIITAEFENLRAEIGTALLPTITLLSNMFVEWLQNPETKQGIEDLVKWLGTNLPVAVQTLAEFWKTTLQPALAAVGGFIVNQLIPAFTTIYNWLNTNIPAALQAIAPFLEWYIGRWRSNYETVMQIVTVFYEAFQRVFAVFKLAFEGKWFEFGKALGEGFRTAWEAIKAIAIAGWEWLKAQVPIWIDNIKTFFTTTDWGAVGSGIIQGIADGVVAAASWLASSVIAAIKAAIDAAKGFIAGVSGDTTEEGRAAGGPVLPGGTYMVGENGPEMLTMGRYGGQVTPINNYNLTINSGARAENVAASFALMKAMA